MPYPVNIPSRRTTLNTAEDRQRRQQQNAAQRQMVEPGAQQAHTAAQIPVPMPVQARPQASMPMQAHLPSPGQTQDPRQRLEAPPAANARGLADTGANAADAVAAPAPTPNSLQPGPVDFSRLQQLMPGQPQPGGSEAALPPSTLLPQWQPQASQTAPPSTQPQPHEWPAAAGQPSPAPAADTGLLPSSLQLDDPSPASSQRGSDFNVPWDPMEDPDYARVERARSRGAVITPDHRTVPHPDGKGSLLYEAGFVGTHFVDDPKTGPHIRYRDDLGREHIVSVHDMRRIPTPDGGANYEFHFLDGGKDSRTGRPKKQVVKEGAVPLFTIHPATGQRMGQAADGSLRQLGYDRNTRAATTLPEVEAAAENDHRQSLEKVAEANRRWQMAQPALTQAQERLALAQQTMEKLAAAPEQFLEDADGGLMLITRDSNRREVRLPVGVNDKALFSRGMEQVRQRRHAQWELQQAQAAHGPLAQAAGQLQREAEKQRHLYLGSQMQRHMDLARRRHAAVDSPYDEPWKATARSLAEDPRTIRREIALRLQEEGLIHEFPELAASLPASSSLPGVDMSLRLSERQVANLRHAAQDATEGALTRQEADAALTEMGLDPEGLRELVDRGYLSPEDGMLLNERINEGHASYAARQQAEERQKVEEQQQPQDQRYEQLLAEGTKLGIHTDIVKAELDKLEKGQLLPGVDSGFLEKLKARGADALEVEAAKALRHKREHQPSSTAFSPNAEIKQTSWYRGLKEGERQLLDERMSDRHVATGIQEVATLGNKVLGRRLELPASDKKVTAKQVFYQWAHGTGPSQRNFTEDSVMGREMMTTGYVLDAVQKAIHNMYLTGKPGAGESARSLAQGDGPDFPLLYPPFLVMDATVGNNTYALHGSMAVRAEVGRPFLRNGKSYLPVRVTGTDDLSAVSGTRLPPFLGGYEHNNSLFSKNNPFGEAGPFRTIKTTYDMQFAVEEVPHMNIPGQWFIDPEKIQPARPPSY